MFIYSLIKKSLFKLSNISFQLRVFLLLLLTSFLVLIILERFLTYSFERYQMDQIGKMAMNQAKIIAANEVVIKAVKERDEEKLAQLAEAFSLSSDFSYVVFGDQHSIRLYHPDPSKLGYMMQWNKPGALEKGESYLNMSEGSIGMALRAKTPVFDENNQVIGVVSLGYLLSKIDHWRMSYILPISIFFAVILGVLVLCSWWFSVLIKRQMHGMEPKEIAQVQRQNEAVFLAVFEGLIAIDPLGEITAINQAAKEILGLGKTQDQLIGADINEIVQLNNFFPGSEGTDCHDMVCTFNQINVIANRAGIWIDKAFYGWIVSFRRKDDIATLSTQLSQVQQYVENLRAVRHEHLNWMSTLSALLQMKEFDRALEMVEAESSNQQVLIDTIRAMCRRTQISALLFGKYHRAKELGLTLTFSPESTISTLPNKLNDNEVATIIANLLDNAFEATLKNRESSNEVEIYVSDEGNDFIIEVADTGCSIAPELRDKIFIRGVSSKTEKGHGIGLYLVATYVRQAGGDIVIEDNTPCGTRFTIFMPKSEKNNE